MIYLTGDCHGSFRRFTKKRRMNLPFELTENDCVIITGDVGLIWAKDKELEYNLNWLSSLPFKILWVQGNHENYDLIEEYPIDIWNGGKVRHIVQDKIILLERGQVFNIEGKSIFTFGGASSHDISGGILDKDDKDFDEKAYMARKRHLPYRIKHISWWEQELPTEEEMQEGRKNLEKVNWTVDYVITHCLSSRAQWALEDFYGYSKAQHIFQPDKLTDYFNELEVWLNYKHWYCGHYHVEENFDEKHTVLYESIIPLRG